LPGAGGGRVRTLPPQPPLGNHGTAPPTLSRPTPDSRTPYVSARQAASCALATRRRQGAICVEDRAPYAGKVLSIYPPAGFRTGALNGALVRGCSQVFTRCPERRENCTAPLPDACEIEHPFNSDRGPPCHSCAEIFSSDTLTSGSRRDCGASSANRAGIGTGRATTMCSIETHSRQRIQSTMRAQNRHDNPSELHS
jgi:hypothetical protein